MKFPYNKPAFRDSEISMNFDIIGHVLRFPTYFGRSSSVRVGYRHDAKQETEGMDYLESIARVPSYVPDKNRVMVRYYGL